MVLSECMSKSLSRVCAPLPCPTTGWKTDNTYICIYVCYARALRHTRMRIDADGREAQQKSRQAIPEAGTTRAVLLQRHLLIAGYENPRKDCRQAHKYRSPSTEFCASQEDAIRPPKLEAECAQTTTTCPNRTVGQAKRASWPRLCWRHRGAGTGCSEDAGCYTRHWRTSAGLGTGPRRWLTS